MWMMHTHGQKYKNIDETKTHQPPKFSSTWGDRRKREGAENKEGFASLSLRAKC